MVHPLPFLAAVVLLLIPRPVHRYEAAALCAYAAWLLPHVLVSYHGRYGFPLIAVKAFLCAASADRVLAGLLALVKRGLQPRAPAFTNCRPCLGLAN